MRFRSTTSLLLLVVPLALAACRDSLEPTIANSPARVAQAVLVPGDTGIRDWNLLADSVLWRYIVESDSTATVGIKAPGSAKGFEKGKVLVSQHAWMGAKAAIAAVSGLRVIKSDTLIPWSRVRISSPEAIATLRALPFVEYIEPAYIVPQRIPFWANSGCGYDQWFGEYDTTPSGDILPVTYKWMRIDRAWAYSTGENVWIGLTDTGADEQQYDLGAGFSSGQSTNRSIWRTSTDGSSSQLNPPCSHGTRMAGVLAAPLNGYGVVGVAWKSNLASIRQANTVMDVNSNDAQQAIRDAAIHGATVIVTAWQSINWMNAVENEIELWYYGYDRMFVGAAGTWKPCDLTSSNNVIFPAEMVEVLAVSPANWDGSKPCTAAYGPELDVIAYHKQPTTGSAAWGSTPVSIEESSNAAGVVGGIAALVRSRYPTMSAPAVMSRIWSTSGVACAMPSSWQRLVNAEAAVGGLCFVNGDFHTSSEITFWNETPDPTYLELRVEVTGGVGPIEITWNNGAVGPTATYAFANLGFDYITGATVYLRDTGTANPALAFNKRIEVYDRTCTPPSNEITCTW